MKTKFFIMIVILNSFIFDCYSQIDTVYENVNLKSFELLNNFNETKNNKFLDTAIVLLDYGILNCEKNNFFKLRKLVVLSIQCRYDEGIIFINSQCDSIFPIFDYYQNLLENRFLAMKYQNKGDTLNRNKYIELIIKQLDTYINNHQDQIDEMMRNSTKENFFQNEYFFPVLQYYFYEYFLRGEDNYENKLSHFKQKRYNIELLSILRFSNENFMIFNGY
jgi:hypothetical protein